MIQELNGMAVELRRPGDLSFLADYGEVFAVFDQNDSGNVSFGVRNGEERYFLKVAGLATAQGAVSPQEAVENLRRAETVYRDLAHPHLVRLRETGARGGLFWLVFSWQEGECLYDHWNFDRYQREGLPSPRERFRALPAGEKLAALAPVMDFLAQAEERGYAAVDFYDGSLLYDFSQKRMTVCDVDCFRKLPFSNQVGERYWGSTRLKAPEEYRLGAPICRETAVFTLGALLFHLFGRYLPQELEAMRENRAFFPCPRERWQLGEHTYQVAKQAASPAPGDRFPTVRRMEAAWKEALAREAGEEETI